MTWERPTEIDDGQEWFDRRECPCDDCRLWRKLGGPDEITWLRSRIAALDHISDDAIDPITGGPLRAGFADYRQGLARVLAWLEAEAN
jgi:hypothetical protein